MTPKSSRRPDNPAGAHVGRSVGWITVDCCRELSRLLRRRIVPLDASPVRNRLLRIARAHLAILVIAAIGVILCVVNRILLWDVVFTILARLHPAADWSARVTRTADLLEKRAHLVGISRHPAMTRSRWLLAAKLPGAAQHRNALGRLAAAVEWSAFASTNVPPWPQREIYRLCSQLEGNVTARQMARFQRAARVRKGKSL